MAVLVLAKDMEVPKPFALHPQILPLPVGDLTTSLPAVSAKLPSNTKLVVIAGELSQLAFGLVTKAAQRRSIPYVHRRNAQAVLDVLRHALPERPVVDSIPDPAPATGVTSNGDSEAAPAAAVAPARAAKGSIRDFIKAEADLGKGAAEEARRLFVLAQQRGIPTTFASLSQGIAIAKREGGRTGVPKSVMSAQQRALATLNEAIAGLELIRE